jgi:hypothetical protein
MMRLMNEVTDKADWDTKVDNLVLLQPTLMDVNLGRKDTMEMERRSTFSLRHGYVGAHV